MRKKRFFAPSRVNCFYMQYLLGIDIGTTGCKATLYNFMGQPVARGYQNYAIQTRSPGWAEEESEEWWQGTVQAIRDCLAACPVPEPEVAAIAISGTNALLPVDHEGKALHPAIMQLDARTQPLCCFIEKQVGGKDVFSITGNRIAPGTFSAPTMLWFKQCRPELYRRTYKFLVPNGFIAQRLTGRYSMDTTRASTTLLFDIRKAVWSETLCDALGIDTSKLPDTMPPEEIAGYLSDAASKATGLKQGIPVAAGAMDTVAAAVGIGRIAANEPFLIVGTVARLCVPMQEPTFHDAFLNVRFAGDVPYLAMAPTNGGGISARWFIDAFCAQEKTEAVLRGTSPYAMLDKLAQSAPKGSGMLLYLPYIAAERSPIWDAHARGIFFGISHVHQKRHFARAVLEGVAYATRHNLELYEQLLKRRLDNIVLSGGGAASKLWTSIFADVLQRTMITNGCPESETKGAAYIAGRAIGVYPSYQEAQTLVHSELFEKPDSNAATLYENLFAVYRSLYPHIKEDFQSLYRIHAQQEQ